MEARLVRAFCVSGHLYLVGRSLLLFVICGSRRVWTARAESSVDVMSLPLPYCATRVMRPGRGVAGPSCGLCSSGSARDVGALGGVGVPEGVIASAVNHSEHRADS